MATMAFGEYTIRIDCDVLQADGGTRTASITGGCVALADACTWLAERTGLPSPFGQLVAAVSVGVVQGEECLDLCYLEDRDAYVDCNVVMLDPAQYVEIQGTGEHAAFSRAQFGQLLDLSEQGLVELFAAQRRVLGW
jgi:ribonuclease PH